MTNQGTSLARQADQAGREALAEYTYRRKGWPYRSLLLVLWSSRYCYSFAIWSGELVQAVLTTSAAATLIAFWFYEVFLPGAHHPYIGLLIFVILPALFVLGLLIMPVGILLRRRQLRTTGQLPAEYPRVDFGIPLVRHVAALVAIATFLNVLIFGTASYRAVSYMDTTQFCGQTCHTVMQPEYTAYRNSPHSRVECVECHIGPGAGWFVRSKLSGTPQVFAVTLHTYERPIPSPVKYLRPARETCEQCHWPQRFYQ